MVEKIIPIPPQPHSGDIILDLPIKIFYILQRLNRFLSVKTTRSLISTGLKDYSLTAITAGVTYSVSQLDVIQSM